MNGNARVLRISDGGARGGLKTDRSWEFWKLKVMRALESMRGGEQILYPRVRSEGVTEREGDREENERGKGVEKSEVLRLKM